MSGIVTCPAGDLRRGDAVRFPDGRGHRFAPVVRRLDLDADHVEILFAGDGGAAYQTYEVEHLVCRQPRAGEAA